MSNATSALGVAPNAATPETLASLDPRRSGDRGKDLRSAGGETEALFCRRERTGGGRSVATGSAIWRRSGSTRAGECAREGGDGPHQAMPTPTASITATNKLPAFAGLAPTRAGRGRTDAHADRAHLCAAPCRLGVRPIAWCGRTISGCPQRAPDPAAVLAAVAEAADAAKALDQFSPPHENYHKLKAALAHLRGKAGGPRDEIAAGPVLRFNKQAPDGRCARAALAREARTFPREATDLRLRRGSSPTAVKEVPARRTSCPRPAISTRGRSRSSMPRSKDRPHRSPSSPTWNAGAGIRATSGRTACHRQPSRVHAQGDARRCLGVEHAHRDRRPEDADARSCRRPMTSITVNPTWPRAAVDGG